jgi:YidC/Oxa1 family membrane protein insertase
MAVVLTKSSMPIIKWVAWLLGWLMNGIYFLISRIGLPNVSIAIILFTIILLVAMTPLQIKQQRYSKLNNVMQPELKKIQKKYAGKKDQVSQQKMMDETNAVYTKYGVSATGSCVQLLIQLPVLFALYQVIYKIPGYITIIGNRIAVIASNQGFVKMFTKFVKDVDNTTLTRNFSDGGEKHIIDAIYGLNSTQWDSLLDKAKGADYASTLNGIHSYVHRATNFLGLNISDSPWDIIKNAWSSHAFLLILAAIAFPVLAWLTQWLNYKLMPQPAKSDDNDAASQMTNTMQSMNNFMPIMSAFFCLTLPVGVGIYWIMSAVVRSVQQVLINKKLDSESIEDIMEQAQKKQNKKREKEGLPPQKIANAAHVSTRTLANEAQIEKKARERLEEVNKKQQDNSTEYYNQHQKAKAGSLAAKANMVAAFDEKNNQNHKKYKK